MQNQKGFILPIVIAAVVVALLGAGGFYAYKYYSTPTPSAQNQPIVGGDRDAHGCIGSAGYSWCEAKQKCLRTWEEPCEADTTADWKTYTNTQYGFSFKYPQILKVAENNDVIANRVVLSHSVAYAHNDPCDFKGDSPQLKDLTDFYVWFNVIPSSVEGIISDNSMPGYDLPKQKVNIGGLSGYKYSIGVEYCGMDYYYFSVAPKKTLWIGSKTITELSPIMPKDEVNKYLAIADILDAKKSETLLSQIFSTFKFTK